MGVRCRLVGAALPVVLTAGLLAGCGAASKTPAQVVQVPQQYKSYFVVASRRCPGVLTPPGMAAMAYVESRFDPEAESGNGAEGLMQILPSVFKQYGVDANGDGKRDIFTAADSVATSAVYTCVLAADVRSLKGDQLPMASAPDVQLMQPTRSVAPRQSGCPAEGKLPSNPFATEIPGRCVA